MCEEQSLMFDSDVFLDLQNKNKNRVLATLSTSNLTNVQTCAILTVPSLHVRVYI